jgi:hypothetical protein
MAWQRSSSPMCSFCEPQSVGSGRLGEGQGLCLASPSGPRLALEQRGCVLLGGEHLGSTRYQWYYTYRIDPPARGSVWVMKGHVRERSPASLGGTKPRRSGAVIHHPGDRRATEIVSARFPTQPVKVKNGRQNSHVLPSLRSSSVASA